MLELTLSFLNYLSVPRVSTDGRPHEILTLIACLSGIVIATIIVSFVVFALRKVTKNESIMLHNISSQKHINSQRISEEFESSRISTETESPRFAEEAGPSTSQPKTKIFTIFGSSRQSFDLV